MKKLFREGKKVIVRPYTKSDYLAWKHANLSTHEKPKNAWDISVKKKEFELTISAFNKILTSQHKNRKNDYFYDFGIFLKDGTLVGGVSLMDISRQVFQNAYLGYRIYNNHWGKGYGKEAVRLTIEIAFKELNLHRLEAGISPKNKRSIALAKSAGLKKEGLSRKRLFLDGKWQDMLLFVALSEDFGVRWKKAQNFKKLVRF